MLSKFSYTAILAFILFLSGLHVPAFAQSNTGLSLSVTPTLFQMSAEPLQAWSSSVKVINNNPYEITIYANVVNFASQGETGQAKFLPVLEEETEGITLAEWITISPEPITIAPEQSFAIPFSVNVPEDAAPGGHFAAILIGTKPPENKGTINVATSQIVSSLFFVRVAGDVIENGVIREFRVADSFVDTPQADLEVRFENKGNVHMQPQGEIVITNMWGKERGIIPINQQTHFGNVLPESVRKFEFAWQGEQSFSDIGRYKAVITLAYGEGNKQFETSATYFYVIPIKAALTVLTFLILFFLLIRWSIKAYVRRMLALAGVEPVSSRGSQRSFMQEGDVRIIKKASLRSPVQSGVKDLQSRFENKIGLKDTIVTLFNFVFAYKTFFAGAGLLCIFMVLTVMFVLNATKEQRDYQVTIDSENAKIQLSSEEILYNKEQEKKTEQVPSQEMLEEQPYDLILINSSDTPGVAAKLQDALEQKGYSIYELLSDFEKSKEKTVIVYDIELQEEALALSGLLNNALLSASPEEEIERKKITIYIGNDHQMP